MERQEQLNFWDKPLTEQQLLWDEVYTIKEKQNNLRRGVFQRHDKLNYELQQLREEVESLKRNLGLKSESKVVEYDFFKQAHA